MKKPSLLSQVLGINVLLVTLSVFVASVAAGLDLSIESQRWQFLVLATAIAGTLLINAWLLRRRFGPLERLIRTMERVDLAAGGLRAQESGADSAEVARLHAAFNKMLDRLEAERRQSASEVLRAQEEERRRIAQDLHDEVNQALTAILLRLEALAQETPPERAPEVAELKRLVNQAMSELLNLARQLRPSALDDHGLVPAIEAQLKRFSAQTGIEARMSTEGDPNELPEVIQTAIYRVAQEALANVQRHAGATVVELDLQEDAGDVELRVLDDGRGFDPGAIPRAGSTGPGAGLGLSGMAERARLVGGELDVRSAPLGGTTVTLRVHP
jgi:two-component system, NarL family, sensor histidine kinase UhpB